MKKLLVILLSLTTLALAACGNNNTVVYKPEKPYWLHSSSYGNTVNAATDELCCYTVTHDSQAAVNKSVKVEYGASTYTTHLTAAKYPDENGTDCYLLTVTYDINGTYTTIEDNPVTVAFNDVTVNKIYFTWDSGIKTIYSEQTAQSTLPANSTATKDKYGNRFITLKYTTTVNYGSKNADTSFKINADGDEKANMANYFSLSDGYTATFKKYNKSNFIDANLLAFAARTFDYADGLSYSFQTIDVLANTTHSMALSAGEGSSSATDLKNLKLNGAFEGGMVNEDYILKAAAYNLTFAINETYSGNAMICQYINEKPDTYHHMMSSMTTTLPYGLGELNYSLSSATTAAN